MTVVSGQWLLAVGYSFEMTFSEFLLIVLAVNLVSAVLCGLIASRGGLDPFIWQVFGALLGPVAFIALAGVLSRKQE
jgi:hypothetical protein